MTLLDEKIAALFRKKLTNFRRRGTDPFRGPPDCRKSRV